VKIGRSVFGLLIVAACGHAPHPVATPIAKIKLVTLPAESDTLPEVAKATTSALAHAKVSGVDESATSKVSIEVVQLSIECVDPTAGCYEAAAKSLSAGKLLFAQIDMAGKKPKLAITLFDAATKTPRTTERTYDTAAAAIAGVDQLVVEATR
jgi:hypothetical protein